MADQYLDWGVGFPGAQNKDDTTELTLATQFTVSESAPCHSVRIRIPNTLPSAPSPAFVSIWDVLDEVNPLAVGSFDWSTQTPNTWAIIPLDDPITVAPGTTYKAACQQYEYWAGTVAFGWPFTTGIITATANNGYLRVGFGYPNIENGSDYSFGVSPVLDVDSGATVTGSGVGNLGALVGAGQGERTVYGSGAANLGALVGVGVVNPTDLDVAIGPLRSAWSLGPLRSAWKIGPLTR